MFTCGTCGTLVLSLLGAPLLNHPIRHGITKGKRGRSIHACSGLGIVDTIATACGEGLNGRLPIPLLVIFFLNCYDDIL